MGVHLFGPLYRASILRAPPGAKGCSLLALAQPVSSHRFAFGQHSRASAVYVLSGSQRQPTHQSQCEREEYCLEAHRRRQPFASGFAADVLRVVPPSSRSVTGTPP